MAHYEHVDIGYNYRMSNLLAALGRAQLARLESMISRRKALRARYQGIFAGEAGVRMFGGDEDAEDNHWLSGILVEPKAAGWCAADLGAALSAENIESRPLWKPMHLQPVFAGARARLNGVSELLFQTGISLPSGSALTDSDQDRVIGHIVAFLRSRR